MNDDRRTKTIALVIENLFTDFGEEFVENVLAGVRQRKDLKLVVISGKFDGIKDKDPRFHFYQEMYNLSYQLEHLCRFDGIIICLGSMAHMNRERFEGRFTTKLGGVPRVFSVTEGETEYISVNYDNEKGIREAVDCLVNVHGFTHFCMLGGRPDNVDARLRREIYTDLLSESGIPFDENNYEATDMSVNCKDEARRLLDRNPDVQAIFCINDSVGAGLFEVMEERHLQPGRDILVFGFDNTKMAGRMIPTLASVGPDDTTLGKKSLETLLALMSGERVESVKIPTRLYGRESFNYEMYEYTTMEMLNVDPDFIDRMFDDCFYRYRYAHISRESVNLKRLFEEFISMILTALKQRYISDEDMKDANELIDIFFENGAMQYTDAGKLLRSIERLQGSVNVAQSMLTGSQSMHINRIFTHMRDAAILALSDVLIRNDEILIDSRQNMQDFLVEATDFFETGEDTVSRVVKHFDKLGIPNAALYLFDEEVEYKGEKDDLFPETIMLRCVTKAGELYVLPKERQRGLTREMFRRVELPPQSAGMAAFPIFYKTKYYGFLVAEMNKDISTSGEFLADQLARLLCVAEEK
ncbi:MAG: substrate-binding domain-containing protein [Clostridiales bacterium]|nr:substrate-binding domain-containing protein [Clostridiales bacterium]